MTSTNTHTRGTKENNEVIDKNQEDTKPEEKKNKEEPKEENNFKYFI